MGGSKVAAPGGVMRELSDEAVADQVTALVDYESRGGSVERWLESKAFGRDDVAAILAELERRDQVSA
jgi:hypothetical protein